MGMYNEVFKKCPKEGCGYGKMQISQIVLGFGGFYLDNPKSIAEELDIHQVKRLKEAVEDSKWFVCQECNESFSIESKEAKEEKMDILKSIGNSNESED